MFTAIANTSALHALRLSYTIELATDCLNNDGFFELGKFLREYDEGPFVGASQEERAALYEPGLLEIEAASGPLAALYPNGPENLTWGYSGLHEGQPLGSTEARRSTLIERRICALGTGHPDQKIWNAGEIPNAIWQREACTVIG